MNDDKALSNSLLKIFALLVIVLIIYNIYTGLTIKKMGIPSLFEIEFGIPTLTPTPTPTPTPAVTPTSTPTITPKEGIQTVQVQLDGGFMHGFFTTNDYIVTMTEESLKNSTEVSVIWTMNNEKKQGHARIVKVGGFAPMATLLKLTDISPPNVVLPIRISRSLKQGDKVERYLGLNDITPGTVLEVGAERKVGTSEGKTVTIWNALVTTSITGPGDAGAPVIDTEENVVGMAFAGDQAESITIPIEDIKVSFPEAFSP